MPSSVIRMSVVQAAKAVMVPISYFFFPSNHRISSSLPLTVTMFVFVPTARPVVGKHTQSSAMNKIRALLPEPSEKYSVMPTQSHKHMTLKFPSTASNSTMINWLTYSILLRHHPHPPHQQQQLPLRHPPTSITMILITARINWKFVGIERELFGFQVILLPLLLSG